VQLMQKHVSFNRFIILLSHGFNKWHRNKDETGSR
jgi:hypothetical protein